MNKKLKSALAKFEEFINHIADFEYDMCDDGSYRYIAKSASIVLGTECKGVPITDPTHPIYEDTKIELIRDPDRFVRETVTNLIEKYYQETDMHIPISFTVTPSRVCYREVWSQHKDGEPVYILEALQNPYYSEQRDTELWVTVVECIVKDLQDYFKQSTITVQYSEREIVYFKEDRKK